MDCRPPWPSASPLVREWRLVGSRWIRELPGGRWVDQGIRPILVRHDISTDDVAGLAAAEGVLTMLGGRTSHAAVVARQMNKVCIVGCRDLVIDRNRRCRSAHKH